MKLLVTGSAGFIGFHLCKALLERGDEVIGLDNFNEYYDPSLKRARSEILEKEKGFALIEGDIRDRATVDKAIKGVDRVVHLAAMAGVRYSIKHPELYEDVNVNGTANILESVKKNDIEGLIYASSSSVYGGNDKLPFAEKDEIAGPIAMYGITKRKTELMAAEYHEQHGLNVTGLRFFTVYGPWGRPDMSLFLFTKAILNDEPFQIFGEGNMQRDFTYIDDIVSGVIAAIDKNYPNEIFNLGRGKQEELMEYVKLIEETCGKEGKKEMEGMQEGDVRSTLSDIAHAKEKLGYDPQTTIKEGVPKFVEWYKSYYV